MGAEGSTQAVLSGLHELAAQHGRRVQVSEDIGDDVTSVGPLVHASDSMAFLSHEALVQIDGPPALELLLRASGDAEVRVDGVPLVVPHDDVVAVVRSVWSGGARLAPALGMPVLHVTTPSDTYRDVVSQLTPWLATLAPPARRRPGWWPARLP